MGIQVICSDSIYPIIEEYIKQSFCTIKENSDICLVEKGFPIPDKALVILFEKEKVNELNAIIQAMNKEWKTKIE